MPFKKFVSKAELWFAEENGTQVYLGDIHSVSINESSNDKEVVTFESDGIAGFIDGPVKTEITFDSAKPRHNQKKNFRKVMRAHQDVLIVIDDGGESNEYRGRIMSVNTTYNLENPSNLQCRIMAAKGQLLSDN